MQYTINQLYKHLNQKVYNVYEVFKNFFNEENVDLQTQIAQSRLEVRTKDFLTTKGIVLDSNEDTKYELSDTIISELEEDVSNLIVSIFVWWKEVTVTNENNKSVNIQDLYAKIEVQLDGRIPYESVGFYLNRATYTKDQFLSDYMHSHIQHIPKEDFRYLMPPCLGKGPIKNTIATLKNSYDEIEWMLFCQELSMYVTVESLQGIPWKRLEEIGSNNLLLSHTEYNGTSSIQSYRSFITNDTLKDFIKYYIQHGHLVISYKNGHFTYGMPYFDYILDISNSFIDFYNKKFSKHYKDPSLFYNSGFLVTVKVSNHTFYRITNNFNCDPYLLDSYKGKYVLKFKGKDIYLKIIEKGNDEEILTTIVAHSFAMYILYSILKVINYRYTNKYGTEYKSIKRSSASCKRVLYL